jgi:ArsR family transcriptional regulator, arsenate/arsenite/antimonite-responsive transcriptional repressor / arsenate reductase (thioredoxin)
MDFKYGATILSALAQETRLRLLRLLAKRDATGLSAGRLAAELGVPPSTLSFHLAALDQAGLVRATRSGRQLIYTVRDAGLRDLLAFVTATCGADRLGLGSELVQLLPYQPEEASALAPAFNVLFLCTHNSARSIMAEAIMRAIGRRRFRSYSAGSAPAAAPQPEVIARLRSLGHDVSGLHSKSWNVFAGADAPRMDFVITLCDMPRGRQYPDFGTAMAAAWPFPDPTRFTGSPVERTALLNELYGSIRRRLAQFCSLPFAALDRPAVQARLEQLAA